MTDRQLLAAKVEALKAELPRISFGYLGNYERWGDDTVWYVFLPHHGRVGTSNDQVRIGAGRDAGTFSYALANWDAVEARVRSLYAADPYRLAEVDLRHDGVLVTYAGSPLLSAQFAAPKFETRGEAEAWLSLENYPATTRPTLGQRRGQ